MLRGVHLLIKTSLDVFSEDLEDLLAPLGGAIADVLIPSITGHYCTQGERELLAPPVRMGGMGLTSPSQEAASEYVASANISGPLAQQIKSQVHKSPDETEIHAAQREMCRVKNRYLKERLDQVKGPVSGKNSESCRPCHPERCF